MVVSAYAALPGAHLSEEYAEELAAVDKRVADAKVLIAEGGAILGCVTLVPDRSSAFAELLEEGEAGIRMLGVRPDAQRRGIGSALVTACVEEAVGLGRRALMLHTTPWMEPAHRLYEKAGFVRDSERDFSPVPDVPLLAFRLDL